MDEEVASLEGRQVAAWAVGLGGIAGGAGLIVLGATLSGRNPEDPNSSGSDASLGLVVGGMGLILISPIIGFVIYPGGGAVLDVVNLHNRRSQTPLKVSLRVDPTNTLYAGGLSVAF
jgi:hypothetical protein